MKSSANCFYPSKEEAKFLLYTKCQKLRSARIHHSSEDNTKRIVVDTRKCGMTVNSTKVEDSELCYSSFDYAESSK